MLQFAPVIGAGSEWAAVNRAGYVHASGRSQDVTKWYTVDLAICTPDPELSELLAGGTTIREITEAFTLRRITGGSALRSDDEDTLRSGSSGGSAKGAAYPRLNTPPSPVSIELWTKRIDVNGEDQATDFPWARWVFPRVYLTLGSRAFGNMALETAFSGWANENENWGAGPLGDWIGPSTSAAQWLPVEDIPDTACGYVAA